MTESNALQVREKLEVTNPAEPTTPGIVFTPDVDIFETEREITLLADMPGVAPGEVQIDLQDNALTISGAVKPFETSNEADILIEFEIGRYYRQFTLSEAIDQDRIEATFSEGVLRLVLPKADTAIPRKIAIAAA